MTRLRNNKMKNKNYIYIVIISVCLLLSPFVYYYKSINSSIITNDTNLKIEKWDTYYSLSKKLDINKNILKIYLRLNTPSKSLDAGIYKLNSWDNLKEIISKMQTTSSSLDTNLTILEWRNIYDIDSYLSRKWLIKSGEFINKSTNISSELIVVYPFLKNIPSLEWFLYPDTYSIDETNFNLDSFISRLLSNFKNRVYDKILFSFGNNEILNIIKLSSIVEKEERNSQEKAVVAWILKKRLEENWYLWADATVCYPHKATREICTPSFVINHIYEKNSYNTRTLLWLPSTPISNPSLETIEATINSKVTPYYYYLHDNNWEIHYAVTNLEHEKNKSVYLK